MSGLRIVTNTAAQAANRTLFETSNRLTRSTERLASGLRINRAADDAAGLALSERIRVRTRGLEIAQRNVQDGISVGQIAEGGLSGISGIVQRVRTLAVQSSNGVYTSADRALIKTEADELLNEINRMSNTVTFNGKKLLQTSDNDTVAAASTGSALGSPWTALSTAVDALDLGTDQIVNFTVSFMIAGVTSDAGASTDLLDQIDASPNNAQFQAEVMDAFTEWKTLLEGVYSTANGAGANLTVNFTSLGLETGNTQDSISAYALPHAENIGDFRIGMHALGAPLAHGYSPQGTPGVSGTVGGDTHFDSGDDWRLDGAVDAGAYSVMMVAAHEIGHNLGLGHDSSSSSLMYPFVGAAENYATKFPGGLSLTGSDAGSLMNRYGVPGEGEGDIVLQVGTDQGETLALGLPEVTLDSLGLGSIDLGTEGGARTALDDLTNALDTLSSYQAEIGAKVNRLQSASTFVGVARENQSAADSRIRELDFADEIVDFTRDQILQQTGVAALSQANLIPQGVLALLG